MKVLMITGDKSFTPGNPRYDLQAHAVERLEAVALIRGGLWAAFKKLLPLRKEKFDVVTAQDPLWRGLVAWHIAWHLGAKLQIQIHSGKPGFNWLERFLLRRADSVRVVSEKIKKSLEPLHLRAPVHVLPIFVDTERFRFLKRQPHDKKTILWVGRFEAEKEPLYAISILEDIRTRGIDATLIMLGAGSLRAVLADRAAQLPVVFPGWQDPAAYLQQADAVLCTSRFESYGASLVEALAAGVPVVAPDVGVAREAGAIIAPRERLAEAVRDALHWGARGVLKLPMVSKEAWAGRWRASLP